MGKRKAVSPRSRFEIFKRDKFTCQYCGSKAPDVVLEVDHIAPVAEGGTNDPLNLVTACTTCNGGKGARRLSDDAEVQRQRDRIEDLAERRLQMEAMLEWRAELSRLAEEQVDVCDAAMQAYAPKFQLSKGGRAKAGKYVEKYGLDAVLDAIDIAFTRYYSADDDATWEVAFQKVGGVLHVRQQAAVNPARARGFYIRGILLNRGLFDTRAVELVEVAHSWGVDLDEVEYLAKTSKNWSAFRSAVNALIDEKAGAENG